MKKIIAIVLCILVFGLCFLGCNKDSSSTNANYDYYTTAYVKLGDKWEKYELVKGISYDNYIALELKIDGKIVPVAVDMKNCIITNEDNVTIFKDEYRN